MSIAFESDEVQLQTRLERALIPRGTRREDPNLRSNSTESYNSREYEIFFKSLGGTRYIELRQVVKKDFNRGFSRTIAFAGDAPSAIGGGTDTAFKPPAGPIAGLSQLSSGGIIS